ncbi:hypothetical protein [Bradyrhizobium tropiciagri]|uniref:hypothetical protein n=1 Tax=Bradyrhizobium tropiciagri TaxID=312253 RepID=UPI000B288904|nr:hypothetical protein [Bradyrhizobium tropiciagri]
MNELLTTVLDAHGGLERWRSYSKVEASIVSGGGFFALKGVLQDANPRRMTVWLHEERSSVTPYGAADQRTMFTPDRIAIEKLDGTLVAERLAPRDSFAGHQMHTPWDPLHRAYFNGEALWTYLATPFAIRNGRLPCRGDRTLARGEGDVANAACLFSGGDRDALPGPGFLF